MDLKKRPEAFIAGYYRTRELFGAALLGAGITGSKTATFRGKKFDTTTADGKALFATDHASKVRGAAQSNVFKDAFSVDALSAVEGAMQDFRGDNGEVLDVAPDTIVIPNIRIKPAKEVKVMGSPDISKIAMAQATIFIVLPAR